jgi:carboxymethylenebutenolidase
MTREIEERRLEAASGGGRMGLYCARPAGAGPHPGLLLLQEAFGVTAHLRDVARRFAREGYAVFAPDLYHRFAPGWEGSYLDFAPSIALLKQVTTEGLQEDFRSAHAALSAEPGVDKDRISCVGFCMGGRAAFLAAATVPLRAAVSYYGAGIPSLLDHAPKVSAPLLLLWGGQDASIPPEQALEVTGALRRLEKPFVSAEFSFAGHGFNCEPRPSYQPVAAAQAWALTLRFLEQPGPR